MPCYYPLSAYKARSVGKNGKRGVSFSPADGFSDLPVTLPCGKCLGCRLEYSRQWAIRCVHEASLHDENCFLTLTYDDEHLPVGGSLVKSDFQKFMKRLRKKFSSKRVSFFHCGEYGDTPDPRYPYDGFGRPHFHALVFGLDFPDKTPFKKSKSGEQLFRSAMLDKLWPFGFAWIGRVSFQSAAYVARYCVKKVNGDNAEGFYQNVQRSTGVLFPVVREYATMSLKPAIGKRWFERFHSDVFPSDFVVVSGRKVKPPKYYDRLNADEAFMKRLKLRRLREGVPYRSEKSPQRLRVREEVRRSNLSLYKRDL